MMKRNKLYTANRRAIFMPDANIFLPGGLTNASADRAVSVTSSLTAAPKTPATANITGSMLESGSSGAAGKIGNVAGKLGTAMSYAGAAVGAFNGFQNAYSGEKPQYSSDAQNGFAQLDTLLTSGKKSKLGTGLVNAGASVMNNLGFVGHGIGALVGGALGTVGTIINNGWGYDVENEGAVKENTGRLRNTYFNAGDYDTLENQFANANISTTNIGKVKNGVFTDEGTKVANELKRQQQEAYDFAMNSYDNAAKNIAKDQLANDLYYYYNEPYNISAFGGPLGFSPGAVGLMQQNSYIDAINNRSNAISKANTMQPITFSTFDAGGFMDSFKQDPIAAAMNYIRQKDAEDEQMAAQAEAEAQQQAFNDLQTRVMAAETQNQGLQALLEDQGRSLASLQEAQRLASLSPSNAATDNWQEGMMEAAREVVRNTGGSSLKDYIKKSEKFSPKAYQLEGEAHPTIGYGFYNVYPGTTRKVKAGDVISQEDADKYLDVAIQERANNLAKKVPNWNKLTSNQQDALIDLAFNAGDNARHFRKNSRLMTALANEDWEAASKQLATTSRNPNFKRGMQNRSNRRRNMFVNGDYSIRAFGGELGTNGTDFTNGLLQVNAGDSHERNPFGGVPMGVDPQGTPNLVEEGETVFNDYVFSKRLKVPKFMYEGLGLGGAMGKHRKRLSFAEVSKKLAEESEMRPNDPISMSGLQASMAKLMEIQEAERMKMQAKQQGAEMDMMGDMGLMAACGGKLNKYDYGGALNWLKKNHPEMKNKEKIAQYLSKLVESDRNKYYGTPDVSMFGNNDNRTMGPRYDWAWRTLSPVGNINTQAHIKKWMDLGASKDEAFDAVFPNKEDRERLWVRDMYDKMDYSTPTAQPKTKLVKAANGKWYKSQAAADLATKRFNDAREASAKPESSTLKYRPGSTYYNSKQEELNASQRKTQPAQNTKAPVSSTPSQAAPTRSASQSTARRTAAPAATKAAQNIVQGNIPPQTDFNTYVQNLRKNPLDNTTWQNQTIADAQWMADQLGMPLEVEGAAPGVNTNPVNRNWNLGNYDWLSGEFSPSDTEGFIPYNRNMNAADIAAEENSDRYKAWTDHVLRNWDSQDVQNYLKQLDAKAGGNHLFDANGNIRDNARDYFQYARGVGDGSNHAWGYYHLTPTWADEAAAAANSGVQGIDPSLYTFTEEGLEAASRGLDNKVAQEWGLNGAVESAAAGNTGTDTANGRVPQYKTWMRYAPAVGAGIFALTDALGITNKHDYTYADKLEAAANRAGHAPNIRPEYIGDYMKYDPFDRLFYANQLQANARATDRALSNTTSPSRNAALLANAYNTTNSLGNLYRQGEEYNRAQYERTKEFNRRTNMFNAQAAMEAQMANARYTQQASQMGLSGLAQAAALRDQIDARTGATKSANLSNLFTSLGNIGRENMAFNMINSTNAARNGYWIDNKGVVHYVRNGEGLV